VWFAGLDNELVEQYNTGSSQWFLKNEKPVATAKNGTSKATQNRHQNSHFLIVGTSISA